MESREPGGAEDSLRASPRGGRVADRAGSLERAMRTIRRGVRISLRREGSGQSLVEFALVVVMFLLLVVGIVEFGRAWNLYQILANASREGARLAALPNGFTTASAVTTTVRNYLAT